MDDYPALQFALGAEAFEALCHEYIERHPSSAPSLNFFGRHMADFCLTEASEPFALRHFAADLAKLEWALVEVLHARVAEALSPEALGAIAPERWGDARLPPSPAARVLRFDYPVNAFFQSFKADEEPLVPRQGALGRRRVPHRHDPLANGAYPRDGDAPRGAVPRGRRSERRWESSKMD